MSCMSSFQGCFSAGVLCRHASIAHTDHMWSIPFLCYAVTTASLAAYMGKGYYDKRKIFPQGVLAGISTVMTLGYMGSL